MISQFRTLTLVAIAVLALGISGCKSEVVAKPEPVASASSEPSQFDLDEFMQDKMKELTINGASLVIIKEGKIDSIRTYGFADVENQKPLNNDTVFEVASISKSIFSQFVMTYVESGELDLDMPLYTYAPHPDLPEDDWHKSITARMVLSHRSGLPNWRENEPDKILRIKFEPGSDYEYSGEGYQYLAFVLREIEGTDWAGLDEAFQKRIAGPIGLAHMSFIPASYIETHKAQPYDKTGKLVDWRNNYWYKKDKGVFVAASSAHTDVEEMGLWIVSLLEQNILSSESYKQMFKHHSNLSDGGPSPYYGLGFVVANSPLGDFIGHSGTNEGFTSYFGMLPDKRWGFAVLTNSESGVALGESLLQVLEL